MKKSKFTDEQIAFALRQAETGTRVAEVCRKMSISEATFYTWKKKFGGLGVAVKGGEKMYQWTAVEEERRPVEKCTTGAHSIVRV